MKILITGGSGFVGTPLAEELRKAGHEVIVTTRQKSEAKDILTWSPPDLIPPDLISEIDAIINLAGEPIAPRRWTEERKKLILSSRLDTTRALVQSIEKSDNRPKVMISASAVGYYGPRDEEPVMEDTSPSLGYLASVCLQWEAEAQRAEDLGVRVVRVRIGGVLGKGGGLLDQMECPFKAFAGGPLGSGKQWFSWIHLDDMVGIIKYALENDSVSGPVNATAPNPVTNREFSKALGRALNRPAIVSVPSFAVKLALGELASVILTGQRVIPEKILEAGYKFKYENIDEALEAIFKKDN
jgi:uncharacterized protein (TIGR01777 family)